MYRACGHVGKELYLRDINRNKYIFDMLLQNIDDKTLNKKNKYGGTALHQACGWRNQGCVKILLEHPEIDVHIFNDHGNTPLFCTIFAPECQF